MFTALGVSCRKAVWTRAASVGISALLVASEPTLLTVKYLGAVCLLCLGLRNATLVAIAMGGSTKVVLHAPELARAAGIDYWREAITQDEFNRMSRTVPVLVNARPFGRYSMVDIDAKGGLPVIVRDLLAAGLLDGSCLTCTGETLAEQVARIGRHHRADD